MSLMPQRIYRNSDCGSSSLIEDAYYVDPAHLVMDFVETEFILDIGQDQKATG